MRIRRVTYDLGNVIERQEYLDGRYGAPGEKRAKKKKATPEEVEQVNQWTRERKARHRLRMYFKVNDYFFTLTYPKHYRDANSKGTMILLKVKLFEYHDKYMELGSIPPYAFENFCDMYESYHELGGNGTGTKMYEEIKDLHLNKKKGD